MFAGGNWKPHCEFCHVGEFCHVRFHFGRRRRQEPVEEVIGTFERFFFVGRGRKGNEISNQVFRDENIILADVLLLLFVPASRTNSICSLDVRSIVTKAFVSHQKLHG